MMAKLMEFGGIAIESSLQSLIVHNRRKSTKIHLQATLRPDKNIQSLFDSLNLGFRHNRNTRHCVCPNVIHN